MGERWYHRRGNTHSSWVTGHFWLQWNVLSYMTTEIILYRNLVNID